MATVSKGIASRRHPGGRWLCVAGAALLFAAPVHAAAGPVEVLIGGVAPMAVAGVVEISLRALNPADTVQTFTPPSRVAAEIVRHGNKTGIWLERAPETAASVQIPANGFVALRYRARLPDAAADADPILLSVPEWNTPALALALPQSGAPIEQAAVQDASVVEQPLATSPVRQRANHFLGNLSVHEPVYAVYGPGTNTDARLQLSFKYQLFGRRSDSGERTSWLNGVHFAYTQRMFWDLGARSSPFRNIDFQPEVFYEISPIRLADNLVLGGTAGFRHESNGRGGDESRSHNQLFIQPMATVALANDYFLRVGPRVWTFVGKRSDNPDIAHYRGNTGLFVQIGKEDGIQLSTTSRLNFGSGKGAFGADISYPLPALWSGGPDFYLYGQSFVGYGENLFDYNHNTRRFRVGIAVVR